MRNILHAHRWCWAWNTKSRAPAGGLWWTSAPTTDTDEQCSPSSSQIEPRPPHLHTETEPASPPGARSFVAHPSPAVFCQITEAVTFWCLKYLLAPVRPGNLPLPCACNANEEHFCSPPRLIVLGLIPEMEKGTQWPQKMRSFSSFPLKELTRARVTFTK